MAYAFVNSISDWNVCAAIDTTGATVIFIYVGGTSSVVAGDIVDSKSNTYTRIANTDNDAASFLFISQTSPTVGSSHSFSVFPGAVHFTVPIYVLCFSGGYNATETHNAANSGTSAVSSIQPGAVTPSAANQILISGFDIENDGASINKSTYAEDYGLTIPTNCKQNCDFNVPPSGFGRGGGMCGYTINPAQSSTNPTFSWTGNAKAASAQAVFGAPPDTGTWKTQNGIIVLPSGSRTLKTQNGLATASNATHNGLTPT